MTNSHDPYNPNTSAGQTAHGALIYNQNQMLRQMNAEAAKGLPGGGGVVAASDRRGDFTRGLIWIAAVIGYGSAVYSAYQSDPSRNVLIAGAIFAVVGVFLLRWLLETEIVDFFCRTLALMLFLALIILVAGIAYYFSYEQWGLQGAAILTAIIAAPFALGLASHIAAWFFRDAHLGRRLATILKWTAIASVGAVLLYFGLPHVL